MQKDSNLFQNYLLPILLTILLILGSLALNLVKIDNIVLTALFFVIIGLAVFLAELIILNISRRSERKNAFALITDLLLSNRSLDGSNILTFQEVTAIEASSEEVWIYAYDLGWEGEDSALSDLVQENLSRGVSYRYIVPNTQHVLTRVYSLLRKYKKVKGARRLVKFKSSTIDLKLVQFGITVYNPTITNENDRQVSNCIVIFFPHYKAFGLGKDARFIAIRGQSTIEVQEGFLEYWNDANEILESELTTI